MNSERKTFTYLGAAFLIQAIGSAIGNLGLLDGLLFPGDISKTMITVANHPFRLRASIALEMITAMGIVMLGSMLYKTLKKVNPDLALVALGLYILEAAILAASRMPLFSLLQVSLETGSTAIPDNLQLLASIYQSAQSFGYELHMLPFACGATMFYYLFFKSDLMPSWLALTGVAAASIALAATLLILLGVAVPIIILIPNLPFEITMGVWFLIKRREND